MPRSNVVFDARGNMYGLLPKAIRGAEMDGASSGRLRLRACFKDDSLEGARLRPCRSESYEFWALALRNKLLALGRFLKHASTL
jgi:hypothetical protein